MSPIEVFEGAWPPNFSAYAPKIRIAPNFFPPGTLFGELTVALQECPQDTFLATLM